MPLYFNARKLPKPAGEYVAWVDGMGTGHALSSSLPMAANFVMKLHLAFARVPTPTSVRLYPVMDGVYVTSANRKEIQDYLRDTYKHLADEFIANPRVLKGFLVRTGIAYGATVHGDDVPDEAFGNAPKNGFSDDVASRLRTTKPGLLLSSAMVNAYRAESEAAPFGFCVHDSALTLPQVANKNDNGFQSRYWKWWLGNEDATKTASSLATSVLKYLSEAAKKPRSLAYPSERQSEHQEAAKEYFAELLDDTI